MNFIFSALTVFAFVLCTLVFIYFLDYGRRLRKEEFIEIAIDRASHIVSDKMNDYWKKHKTGPWYLVVYTLKIATILFGFLTIPSAACIQTLSTAK